MPSDEPLSVSVAFPLSAARRGGAARVDGGAAEQGRVGEGRPAVVLERAEERIDPALIVSREAARVETVEVVGVPHGALMVLTPLEQVAVPIVFLGRHELSAPADPIPLPCFFQIEGSDVFAVGIRWRFAKTAVLSVNALVPLNRDGLRPDVIPIMEIEYSF